ncbi:class I SAM-dependent methyltransferase [Puia sp. P3]|uniref:class I SAM-dependent methyltransferase n=1 Tax=Puia sp. P3 TaxID=3423952 RepID=UPI003D6784D6
MRHFEQFFIPVYQRSLEQLQLTKRRSLLDFGHRPGLFSMMAARTGATVRVADGPESLPFGNDSFDAITAFNSLQYAASPDKALKEARRVLRIGGRAGYSDLGPART